MVKILTIEDSAFERAAIIQILNENNYTDITEAEDGESGLDLYDKKKPDIVLLDLRLPGMDGLECLKKLKQKNPNVKVIIVTIVSRKDSIDEAKKLGAADYVLKPITKDKLIPAIKKIIN